MSVKWGIVGTADIATKVSKAIQRAKNAELLAIGSRSSERAEKWAMEHGASRSYGSYEALLDDPDVAAVYIPLPPSMHSEWGIKAAKAGKHVLSEKPLTMDIGEAVALEAACSERGVQLMDGVMWVHHDRSAEVKQVIQAGELGPLRRVTACFAFKWGEKIPTDNIRAQEELGGGSLGDTGYYCIRAILWAFGELPKSVYARSRYANNVDIETSAMLYFSDDRTASFDCGFTMNFRAWLELVGADASMVFDEFVLPESESESFYYLRKERGSREQYRIGPCVQEVKMIERFSNIVETGEIDTTLIKDALDTVRVCSAVASSARTGRIVEVNPA